MAKSNKHNQSATRIAAAQSLNEHARKKASYEIHEHGDRDSDGNVIDGHHLRRTACAKGLERFAKPHSTRSQPFLQTYHLVAASMYQTDVEAAQGSFSHEIKPFVDKSGEVQSVSQKRIDAAKKIGQINIRMNPTQRVVVDTLVVYNPDKSFSEAFMKPGQKKRDKIKGHLRDGLHWLAIEYGIISAQNHPFDKQYD